MTSPEPTSASDAAVFMAAARWVARLQGPDGDRQRAALEAWLAEDPAHLLAYRRLTARFDEASVLKGSALWPAPGHARSRLRTMMIPAIAALAATLLLTVTFSIRQPSAAHSPIARTGAFRTHKGEIRSRLLSDGSRVVLDTDTLVEVHFSDQHRWIRLLHGRARFVVAHETRPFTVIAGDSQVTARGTIFDVDMLSNREVRVALLRGIVDVNTSSPDHDAAPGRSTTLRAGQQLVARADRDRPIPIPLADTDLAWPSGMVNVDDMPLGLLLAQANRYSPLPVALGDASLAGRRVSGRFRIDDPIRLAENLARLLGLEIDRTAPSGVILLQESKKVPLPPKVIAIACVEP